LVQQAIAGRDHAQRHVSGCDEQPGSDEIERTFGGSHRAPAKPAPEQHEQGQEREPGYDDFDCMHISTLLDLTRLSRPASRSASDEGAVYEQGLAREPACARLDRELDRWHHVLHAAEPTSELFDGEVGLAIHARHLDATMRRMAESSLV